MSTDPEIRAGRADLAPEIASELTQLAARVAELERRFQALTQAEAVMRRALMDDGMRQVAEREAKALSRHLKAVE